MNGEQITRSFNTSVEFASQLSEKTEAYIIIKMDDEGLTYHTNGNIYTVLGIVESMTHSIKQGLFLSEEDRDAK